QHVQPRPGPRKISYKNGYVEDYGNRPPYVACRTKTCAVVSTGLMPGSSTAVLCLPGRLCKHTLARLSSARARCRPYSADHAERNARSNLQTAEPDTNERL